MKLLRGVSIISLSLFLATNALAIDLSGISSKQVPKFNEVVKDEIYRGGQPTNLGLNQLASAGFKTVINLRRENPNLIVQESKILKSLGVKMISVPLNGYSTPSDKDMKFIEDSLNDATLKPIFIHCKHGEDRTGLAVGLYRVFTQGYTPKVAYQEMLDLGFKPWLTGLDQYFKDKTGY